MNFRLAPLIGLLIALLTTLAVYGQRTYNLSTQWELAEYAILDVGFRLRGPRPVGDEAVIIGIDDRTIEDGAEIYERRASLAGLITQLYDFGAKAVALDLLLAEPEYLIQRELSEKIEAWHASEAPRPDPVAAELLEEVYQETLGDELLLEAIKRGPTILAMHLGDSGGSVDEKSLTRGTYGQVVAGPYLPHQSSSGISNAPMFNKAAKRLGALKVSRDDSNVSRTIPIAARTETRHYVPMGIQLAAASLDIGRGLIVLRGDTDAVDLDGRNIQADRGGLWLNWRGRDAFRSVSAVDVVNGLHREDIEGRVAILALTHLAQDRSRTPFGAQPGVQSHLTLMDNVLRNDLLQRASIRQNTLFTLVLGLLTTLLFVIPGLRLRHVAGVVVLGLVSVLAPLYLLFEHSFWLESLGAKFAVGGTAVACMATAWLQEGAQARALRGAFAQYVSDDLLKVISSDPTLVSLQGQRRELSILFSDIRDFTSHSERMDPLELVAFLNAYLTPMTRAVLDHRGFVDKFIGDAVMALFGAPIPDPQHPEQAARAALAMHRALQQIQPIAVSRGIDLAIGVGINSGVVALGNLGSEDRFEYTVLGDAVNLASRLEGLTKTYGVFCLLGPQTSAALGPAFHQRTIDLVRVKGKDEPVEIFELMGFEQQRITWYEALDRWIMGIGAWRAGDFPRAQRDFEAFLQANPDDTVVALYLERLRLAPTAPDDWDGVFTHTEK